MIKIIISNINNGTFISDIYKTIFLFNDKFYSDGVKLIFLSDKDDARSIRVVAE